MKRLNQRARISNENESMKLAEIIMGDHEYRTSCAEESRLLRVTSSITALLEDEGARQIFAQCLREWQCEENLYFYCDVEEWSLAVAQLASEMSASEPVRKSGSSAGGGDSLKSRSTTSTSTRDSSMRPTSGRFSR